MALVLAPAAAAQADVGFLDGSFAGNTAATGMKPQSKLWFADGIWWAVMFNASPANRFEIFRRNAATETWSPTGTAVDGRKNIWSDAKWDGTHLYVVTHGSSESSTSQGIRISRFAYDSASKQWSLSSGFPLTNVGATAPNSAPTGTEGAVIDTDSTGRIWLAWTRGAKAWVTHSTTSQTTFVEPYVPPVPNADNLTTDDMATLVAYDGRIGVLWSNQNVWCMCFAIHADGDPDGEWTSRPMIGPLAPQSDKSNEMSDDHMNLKAANDGSGRLFAVTKTSRNQPGAPLLLFNVLNGTTWSNTVLGTVAEDSTRAIVAIDTQNDTGYAFSANPCCSGGIVYMKQTSLTTPGFPAGLGTPFIQRGDTPTINNATTTKQTVDGTSDLVVMAGDDAPKRYVHNTLDIAASGAPQVPDTTITSGPAPLTNSTSASLAFTSNDAAATFECKLDGGAFAGCASPSALSNLSAGSHTFSVRAVKGGAVDPSPATRTWTIDTAAPAAPLASLAPGSDTGSSSSDAITTDTTPTLTGTAEAGAIVRLSANGSQLGQATASAAGDWTVTLGALAEGSHPLTATATDQAGNESIASSALTIVIDTTAPSAPAITSPADDLLTSSRDVTVAGTSAASLRVDVVDGAALLASSTANAAGGWSAALTNLADGAHPISAIARDVAGNASPPSATRVVTVDTVAPDTTITRKPANPSGPGSATFEFTATQSGSTFECSRDGGAFEPCTSPESFSAEAGQHSFEVWANDPAGNVDQTPATWSWVVTGALPAAPVITAPADDSFSTSTTVTVSGTAQNGQQIEVRDGTATKATTVAGEQGAWSVDVTGLADGAHTLRAFAIAVLTSEGSNPVTVTVDTAAPQTTIGAAPANPTNTGTASLSFSSDEGGATFECRLDGSPWSTCTSPYGAANLAQGSHTFEVRATDRAGNVDATPADHTWVVDTTTDTIAPDTTIESGPSGTASSASATFTFSSNEAGSTFECRIDGGAYVACASPHHLTGLASGSHTFEVRASDAAGNTDATPASRTWQVQLGGFSDGFESGSFSAWSPGLTGGLGGDGTAAVVTDTVKTGTYAARLSATVNVDSFARLRFGMPLPSTALTVEENIRVEAEGAANANVPLLRLFNASGARMLSLYRQNATSGAIHVSHGTPTSTSASLGRNLALNTWANMRVRVIVGPAGAGTVTITWDGVQAYTTSVASLGSAVATIQVGNETKRQAFRLVVDDVVVTPG